MSIYADKPSQILARSAAHPQVWTRRLNSKVQGYSLLNCHNLLPQCSVLWISWYMSVGCCLPVLCAQYTKAPSHSLPPFETFSLQMLFINCITMVILSLQPLWIAASLSIYPHIYHYIYHYVVSIDQSGFKFANILEDEASLLYNCSPIKNTLKHPTGSKFWLAKLAKQGKALSTVLYENMAKWKYSPRMGQMKLSHSVTPNYTTWYLGIVWASLTLSSSAILILLDSIQCEQMIMGMRKYTYRYTVVGWTSICCCFSIFSQWMVKTQEFTTHWFPTSSQNVRVLWCQIRDNVWRF